MTLHLTELQSRSNQDRNAGNGGDVIKHSVYLALLDELRHHDPWRCELHVVEAHAGKGVYVLPTAREFVREGWLTETSQQCKLCAAQREAFGPAPDGLGRIDGLMPGEYPYAASAVLQAFAIRDLPQKSLLLMDRDSGVTKTLTRVLSEPAFRGLTSDVLRTRRSSEEELLDRFSRSCFGARHVVHLDPFAFVAGNKHRQEREWYAELLETADRCVASLELAAFSVFITWGQNSAVALADMGDADAANACGYQGLRAKIGSERRITLEWCWSRYFAMLLVVPAKMRQEVIESIRRYCEPFASRRKMFRVY